MKQNTSKYSGNLKYAGNTSRRGQDVITRGERSYYIMDDDLTDAEIESLINCEKEYREHPQHFTPLEDVNWD